jgi:hypothetical protein
MVMSSEFHETHSKVTVEHFLAGLAVWAVLMVVYAVV